MIEVEVIPEDVANARWERENRYPSTRCVIEHALARTLDVEPGDAIWGIEDGSIRAQAKWRYFRIPVGVDAFPVRAAIDHNDYARWDEIRPFKFVIEEYR